MNLQSKNKRWLAAVTLAKEISGSLLETKVPMPLQAQEVVTATVFYELRLTAEADPIEPNDPLYKVLGDIFAALDGLKVGPEFRTTLETLDRELDAAASGLQDWVGDVDSKIEDIIGELERGFLISLVTTLTSHGQISNLVENWKHNHQGFLQGMSVRGERITDFGHYIDIKTMTPSPAPGPGKVHVQHLQSALNRGATVFVAGAAPSNVENYAELQSVVYAQWFTYMHAIWDEQFRGRIAKYFDDSSDRIRRRDVVNDFFGDIRLIRNDFVHKKGIADEAVAVKVLTWGFKKGTALDITTEQMISLIDLFPRDALAIKPNPLPDPTRKNVPRSVNPDLLDDFLDAVADLQLDKNSAIEQAITMWIDAQPDRQQ